MPIKYFIWNEMVEKLSEDFQSVRDLFPVDKIKSWFKINTSGWLLKKNFLDVNVLTLCRVAWRTETGNKKATEASQRIGTRIGKVAVETIKGD